MDPKQTLYEFQMERYEIFKAQDLESGGFDVIFQIGDKKLYAHKFALFPISTTFASMLSDRWNKDNEPIKIDGHSFEDFKQFLTFIYSGSCNLTKDNIVTMVDIAEFYDVKLLKKHCETYLTKMVKLGCIFQLDELANKYSLIELKDKISKYVAENLSSFFNGNMVKNFQSYTVKAIVKFKPKTVTQERLFQMVYNWAENRAMLQQRFDKSWKKVIKEELSEILPLMEFDEMDANYFKEYVVKRAFIFTYDQFKRILAIRSKGTVKITNENGKIMKGQLVCDNTTNVVNDIQSLKNARGHCHDKCCYSWGLWQTKPSTRSKLKKNENVSWYLVYDRIGSIAVKHRTYLTRKDYLLAEMFAEDVFEFCQNCSIEIFHFP